MFMVTIIISLFNSVQLNIQEPLLTCLAIHAQILYGNG